MFSNVFSEELSLPYRQYRLGICEQTLWSLLIVLLRPYSERQQERAGESVQDLHVAPLNLPPEITMKGSGKILNTVHHRQLIYYVTGIANVI